MDDNGMSGHEARRRMSWGVGIALGVGVGTALGVSLDNIGLGVAFGVAIGVAFAAAFGREPKPPRDDADGDRDAGGGPDSPSVG